MRLSRKIRRVLVAVSGVVLSLESVLTSPAVVFMEQDVFLAVLGWARVDFKARVALVRPAHPMRIDESCTLHMTPRPPPPLPGW